jgi:hypothetical protein
MRDQGSEASGGEEQVFLQYARLPNAEYLFRGHCYKTFYICKLLIFIKARAFVPGKPFQPSLMFVGKTEAYPSVAPVRCSTLR